MTDIALILVAAGRGNRAGLDIPKQYKELAGKALINHTLDNAAKTGYFGQVLVVISPDDDRAEAIIGDRAVSFAHGGLPRKAAKPALTEAVRVAPP